MPVGTSRSWFAAGAVLFMLISGASTSRLAGQGVRDPLPPQQDQPMSATVRAQIQALTDEKASRTPAQRKMDSQLVYEVKSNRGEAIGAGLQTLVTDVPRTSDARLIVDVSANVSDALLAELRGLGAEVLSSSEAYHTARLALYPDAVEAVAALDDVRFVQPKQESFTQRFADREQLPNFVNGVGSKTTEGDKAHRAYAARGAFHTTGAGIKVGVISDGVRNLAASQALGDLGAVTVLGVPDPCPASPATCDEGTAMLEIIHDLAPGAQLYFASAYVSISDFAQKIRDLQAAGCTVIVDDVGYFVESPFQDGQTPGVVSTTNGGVVSQAVKDVAALGVLYFSAAANSGNLDSGTSGTWEGNFLAGGAAAGILAGAGQLHNFGTAGSPQTFDVVSIAGTSPISLAWSDPLGGSANDYDLFKLNSAGTAITGASTNVQDGTQDPFEQMAAATLGERIVVVKSSGADRFLHLSTNRARLSIATSGETHGHAATSAANSFGVAAVNAGLAPANGFTSANVIESFSSDGLRRIFFNANGSAITPGNFSSTGGQVLQKPDLTAADGVTVTGVGGFASPFFGTSAAAPHAAAIAALIKSANPALTPAQIRTAMTSSAIDISTAGVDRNSGAGIVMAFQALQAAGVTGTAFLADTLTNAFESPGNGNGAINVGEGAQVNITLTNLGVAAATGISATLTAATPGVTMMLPGTSSYPDLAVGASAVNTTPFRFTVASNAGCPLTINLTLTVTYAGGLTSVLPIVVTEGASTMTITTTLDGTAPAAIPGVTVATGSQTGRIVRNGVVSTCAAPKVFPGIQTATGSRQFDSYAFNTCAENTGSCATVSVSGTGASNLFTVAYAPSFTAASTGTNYKADPGSSFDGAIPYSFSVASGANVQSAVVVHEVNTGGGVGTTYTLTVSGICAGISACATPNQVPIARAHDVTVLTGPGGTAAASINNGSSDGDGDALTITQLPAGPYSIGTTSVLLTVVDPKGATSQATANVTVFSNPPLAAITTPTANPTLSTAATTIDLAGTASDDLGVTSVTWINDRGGSGTASGTASWSIAGIPLRSGANVITVTARDGEGQTGTDVITITQPPTMALSASVVNFGVVNNGGLLSPATPTQTLTLTQSGPATVTWTVSATQPWISVTPTTGSGGATLTLTMVNPAAPNQLPVTGSLAGSITVNTSGAANSPSAAVNLTLVPGAQVTTPIGQLDTPTDGQANVFGSIAVTGWAIDDIGVIRVEIMRDPVAGEGAVPVYIGDAVFVSGARPDIAALYPTNPLKDQAGWGYLLLTNFLPNHGNGTFRLHAFATDVEGHRVLLGSKTLTCANATAIAPFGAIDTPTQGGTVSGSFVNFGWVLAGQGVASGRAIPTNGSTIQVFIDSAPIGLVDSYNNPRVDIQTLFPGFANTDGAIGLKTINSATFANGVHTISWLALDNLGAASGIGSRYFTVSNSSLTASSMAIDIRPPTEIAAAAASQLAAVATESPESAAGVTLRRGYDSAAPGELLKADGDGVRVVRVAPLQRIALRLPAEDATYSGYSLDGERLGDLPIGSHFDPSTGVFAWMPGVGFGGTHQLVFVAATPDGERRIRVDVRIEADK